MVCDGNVSSRASARARERAEAALGAGAVSQKSRARPARASLHVPAGHLGHQVAPPRAGARDARTHARVFFHRCGFFVFKRDLRYQVSSRTKSHQIVSFTSKLSASVPPREAKDLELLINLTCGFQSEICVRGKSHDDGEPRARGPRSRSPRSASRKPSRERARRESSV